MRWSRLQKLIYDVWRSDLGLQIHCNSFALSGASSVGRYWITLGKEIIWDCPKDFPEERDKGVYNHVATEITKVIRQYLDTPRDRLMTETFHGDRWGLIDIFRAADRRIGSSKLAELAGTTDSEPARRILDHRESIRTDRGRT